MSEMRDKLGLCQWFHYQDYRTVERTVALLKELGVRHLRTGVSWADYHRPQGYEWYRWQMEQLSDFEVLLSVWHTPPSIAQGNECAGPPRRLEDYGDFIGQLIDEFGDYFSHFELWNEPNNRIKWAFDKYDPRWAKFGRMVRYAGQVAQEQGKPTVLGGMIPVDHHWLQLIESYGALEHIDIVAIHGFPEMWWPDRPNWEWYQEWYGWEAKTNYIASHTDKPIWITETGLATWDFDQNKPGRHGLQCEMLRRAAAAPVERVYWYSAIDLAPEREAIEGFHVDENEYHLGLITNDSRRKPAYATFADLLDGRPTSRGESRRRATGKVVVNER